MLSEPGQKDIADYINDVKVKGKVLFAAIEHGNNNEMVSDLLDENESLRITLIKWDKPHCMLL